MIQKKCTLMRVYNFYVTVMMRGIVNIGESLLSPTILTRVSMVSKFAIKNMPDIFCHAFYLFISFVYSH